ncbi:MAG: hypothetical protein KGI71_03375, partial [Patescibacteria group bacterium]|nr:hypothetical protein [Patescibacteria group bacterium]
SEIDAARTHFLMQVHFDEVFFPKAGSGLGRLWKEVCDIIVAADWLAIYNSLPPDVIQRLKGEYRNWSN